MGSNKFSIMTASKQELTERIEMYLNACVETATVPTCKGFARSIGYSDSRLRAIRLYKRGTYQAELLEMFADTVCEINIQGGLTDILNPKVARFRANPHLTMRARKGEEGYGHYMKLN